MTFTVAIIGAGLSGLALALSLHKVGIKSAIYESRSAPLNIGGAVMLSPNGLRVIDKLNVYETVKSQGFNFDVLEYRSAETGNLIDTQEFGNESSYGYKGNRIYRHELIDALLAQIQGTQNPKIEIHYGRKFSHIIKETDEHVTWQFTDSATPESASLLIGADGIHSSVRKYIYPNLVPEFTGMAGITASVPTSQVSFPSYITTPFVTPLALTHPSAGGFVIAPQKVDGSEVLIGKQRRYPLDFSSREEWDAIHADKDAAIAFLRSNNEVFGEIAKTATAVIPADRINIWPFYVVPKLERWVSRDGKGRVVILGDAAHAVPPSAGQGVNQAFEDTYLFAGLVGAVVNGTTSKHQVSGGAEGTTGLAEALRFWQEFRQNRVDGVLELNRLVDERRMPKQTRDNTEQVGREKDVGKRDKSTSFDLKWLFSVDLDDVVDGFVSRKTE